MKKQATLSIICHRNWKRSILQTSLKLNCEQYTSSTETLTITGANQFAAVLSFFSRDQAFKEFLCPFYLTWFQLRLWQTRTHCCSWCFLDGLVEYIVLKSFMCHCFIYMRIRITAKTYFSGWNSNLFQHVSNAGSDWSLLPCHFIIHGNSK